MQLTLAQGQNAPGILHRNDAVFRFAHLGEVGNEALPHAGDDQRRLGGGEPAVQRRDDVRIGVRGNQVRELVRRKIAHHAHVQLVEGQIATRIDDGSGAMVHDQELVGLYGLRVFLHQIGEHQTSVVFVPVQLHRCQRHHFFHAFVTTRCTVANAGRVRLDVNQVTAKRLGDLLVGSRSR
ncbi:hypothetical protein D3C72_1657200 [compost metagenome]